MNGYPSKYLNDFNKSSAEPTYDYDLAKNLLTDDTQIIDELKNGQDDDNLEIYPDPDEIFRRRMLNKTRFGDRHDESIIKICK